MFVPNHPNILFWTITSPNKTEDVISSYIVFLLIIQLSCSSCVCTHFPSSVWQCLLYLASVTFIMICGITISNTLSVGRKLLDQDTLTYNIPMIVPVGIFVNGNILYMHYVWYLTVHKHSSISVTHSSLGTTFISQIFMLQISLLMVSNSPLSCIIIILNPKLDYFKLF